MEPQNISVHSLCTKINSTAPFLASYELSLANYSEGGIADYVNGVPGVTPGLKF